MAIKNKTNGFTLLIALIFMSVMLSFGLALGSLAYKQQVLASGAVESQYAFYAADSALECMLFYDDQVANFFAYPAIDPGVAPSATCAGAAAISATESWSATRWVVKETFSLDSGAHCADATIYKYKTPVNNVTTYIFAQGYDVSCSALTNSARVIARGISVHY